MYEPHSHRSTTTRGRTNLASCIVATIFLIFIIAVTVIVFFFVFKPKEPLIAVDAVQFPTFSLLNGTVNFTFFQNVSVTNPNRDEFTHYDSSLRLLYSGGDVGVVPIPAGTIYAGRTQHMAAKFAVDSFPVSSAPASQVSLNSPLNYPPAIGGVVGGFGDGSMMEMESRMELVGRVRVLKIFTHRVESKVRCGVAIEVSSGSVLGIRC